MAGGSSNSGGSATEHLNIGIIAGIAVAGFVILVLLLLLALLLLKARKSHKRHIADLESRGVVNSRHPSIAEIRVPNQARTRTVLRRNTVIPYGNRQSGWDSLNSHESFGQPPDYVGPLQPIRTFEHGVPGHRSETLTPKHFPWPFSRRLRRGQPLVRASTLSAITEAYSESPRSQQLTALPIIPDPDEGDTDQYGYFGSRDKPNTGDQGPPNQSSPAPIQADQENRSDSPQPDAVASPALKPDPLFSGNGAETIRLVAASRSRSIASLPSWASRGEDAMPNRPAMHARSRSLCNQSVGMAPDAPVPPLPVQLSAEEKRSSMISNLSLTRLSVSSIESGGSSVLINSPNLAVKRERSFKLKEGAGREWTNSLISGPREQRKPHAGVDKPRSPRRHQTVASHGSIKSAVARYSGSSCADHLSRPSSVASSLSGRNRLSAGRIGTAETIRLSRLSSSSSKGSPGVQLVHTPRRHSRFVIDAKGSPSERTPSILQDISGNSALPQREHSQSSRRNSTAPDDDNQVFQWDPTPMQPTKPSALKGSPGARKPGHRRQNCVRISLQPTILGPGSRTSTPSPMNGIEEEPTDYVSNQASNLPNPLTTKRELPRPPSTSTFQPEVNLGPNSLRASLTSTSPTLSLVNFCPDNGLPLDTLGLGSNLFSPYKRTSTRMSAHSSQLSIPSFPSPGKDPAKTERLEPPTVTLSRPSIERNGSENDEEEIFQDAPSSPLPQEPPKEAPSIEDQLLAAFLALSSSDAEPSPKTNTWQSVAQDAASSPLLSAEGWHIDRPISPRHLQSSPPCSPKSLQPKVEISDSIPTTNAPNSTTLPVTEMPNLELPSSKLTPQSSPTSISRSNTLLGPRAQPAKPLKSAVQALRRMNSDVGNSFRAERQYLHMGRGASPALPGSWYRDSYADFGAVTAPGEEPGFEVGLGILDGLAEGDEVELDVDVMLGLSDRASGVEQVPSIDLSWLDSDEGDREWKREDSGTLGSAEAEREWNSSIRKVEQEESRRSSSVWEDGEKFWEQKRALIECPSSPCPAHATLPSPGADFVTPTVTIPGLSYANPSPQPTTNTALIGPRPMLERVQERASVEPPKAPGANNTARKRRPERLSSLRKSAALNMSMSAGNQRTSVEDTAENKSIAVNAIVTPEGPQFKMVVQPPTGSSVIRKGGVGDTPVSLYDEDGFLKT